MSEYINKTDIKNEFGELFTLCNETLPNENGFHFIVEEELQTAYNHIMNLSTIKIRHGKWNTFKASSIGCIDIEIPYCSECGMSPLEIGWKYQSPYCPNCGARMGRII